MSEEMRLPIEEAEISFPLYGTCSQLYGSNEELGHVAAPFLLKGSRECGAAADQDASIWRSFEHTELLADPTRPTLLDV